MIARVKMDQAIVKGITGKVSVENTIQGNNTLYRVQVGTFKEKTAAEALIKKIKAAGFDCYVTK